MWIAHTTSPLRRLRLNSLSVVLMAVVVLAAGCGDDVDDQTGTSTTDDTTTTGAPTTDPATSLFPADLPADFEASFSQDGGMTPWFEDIVIGTETSTYEVFIDGVTVGMAFTPDPARVEALYQTIVEGRFDLYAIEPFEDDDMIFDAETTTWVVEAGGERHRLSAAGETILVPEAPGSPLAAIEGFVDTDDRTFDQSLTLVLDESLVNAWQWDFIFQLAGADVGIGAERFGDELDVSWVGDVGPLVDVIVRSDTGSETVLTVPFEDGSDLRLSFDQGSGADPNALAFRPVLSSDAAGDVAEMGPVLLGVDGVESATAVAGIGGSSEWGVALVLREGSPGIDDFNAAALSCASQLPDCPTGRLAIVVDGTVVSAPLVQAATFARDQISISGSFTQLDAEEIAAVLDVDGPSGSVTPIG